MDKNKEDRDQEEYLLDVETEDGEKLKNKSNLKRPALYKNNPRKRGFKKG